MGDSRKGKTQMKAAFILEVDHRVHNFIRNLARDIDRRYHTDFLSTWVPPHISVKLPFNVPGLDEIEEYFDLLAASVQPIEIRLNKLELSTWTDGDETQGVLWLVVQENAKLRDLHLRINRELAERFEDTHARYDGPDFRFHATVAIRGAPLQTYRDIYADYRDIEVDLRYTASRISLIWLDDSVDPAAGCIFRILPLGQGA